MVGRLDDMYYTLEYSVEDFQTLIAKVASTLAC